MNAAGIGETSNVVTFNTNGKNCVTVCMFACVKVLFMIIRCVPSIGSAANRTGGWSGGGGRKL